MPLTLKKIDIFKKKLTLAITSVSKIKLDEGSRYFACLDGGCN
jgi:hypothetical protein